MHIVYIGNEDGITYHPSVQHLWILMDFVCHQTVYVCLLSSQHWQQTEFDLLKIPVEISEGPLLIHRVLDETTFSLLCFIFQMFDL